MFRNRALIRFVSIFFVIEIIFNVVYPTIGFALTSGPTAPEATSFEPVDTTDMVNLATGDFIYNLPLLEVPGPSGGYPISLSYHAGIQPNEDASWVGLGWTLNPGAIARTVNGYPDDQFGAIRTRQDYISGGTRHTFSLGVGVSGASLKLSISNDSNLGIGVGVSSSIGPSFGVGKDSGIGIDAGGTIGTDGYGNSYSGLSVGLSVGKADRGAKGLSVNIGVSTNFNSVSLGGGVNYGKSVSLVGGDISSNGLKPSMSVAGISLNQVNSAAGKLTTQSWGISTPPLPIGPFTLTLGYNYLRYYSDETANVNLIGSLNAPLTSGKNPDTWSFDSYALLNPDAAGGVIENSDPEKSKGGSFPAYDSYNVMAQGLGGSMQPYIFDNGTLFRQNLKTQDNSSYIIKYNTVNSSFNFTRPVQFRFKNDFSNSLTYGITSIISNGSTASFQGLIPTTPSQGYNQATSHLAGSRHIEYFTNHQIKDGTAKNKGFIDVNPNSSREIIKYGYNVADQIGGFMITNESGVTYHYALPVYSYYQVHKTFETGKEASKFQKNSENHPYAYTWFLTAVTGPDYVNRNSANDGTIGNQDWGYWVKFTYQLQTNSYIWRNPIEGTHIDINQKVESYSYGQKEIFYLDKIQTQSHIAVFEKSERVDGRGVNNGITGNFAPSSLTNCYTDPNCNPANCTDPDPRVCDGYCQICETTPVLAAKTLKLDKIYLLTLADYLQPGTLLSKALRVISFNTDYSLSPGTPNSFSDSNISIKLGKLTLNSVTFLGKAGAVLMPPISFTYAKNPIFNKDAFDVWGLYKSDYVDSNNDNLDRLVSNVSYQNLDSWSMNSITTSLGAKISVNYEGDTYNKPALYFSNLLNIKSITPNANYGSVKIEFHNSIDATKLITLNSAVKIIGLISYPFYRSALFGHSCDGQLIGQYGENYKSVKFDFNQNQIVNVANNYIDVVNEQLFKDVTMVLGQYPLPATLPYPKNDVNIPCYNSQGQEVVINVTYSLAPRWMSGNIAFERESSEFLGGGIRVKEISINENENVRTTSYNYLQGMTSYEPMGLDNYVLQYMENITNLSGDPWNAIIVKRQKAIDSFLSNLYDQFSTLLTISREIPAPGIIYGKVIVTEEIRKTGETSATQIPGSKVYEFQVFDENIVERLGISTIGGLYPVECFDSSGNLTYCGTPPPNPGPPPVFCKDQNGNTISCTVPPGTGQSPITLKDFSSWVGTLKSVTTYGPNNEILESTTNQYLHDGKTNDQFIQDLKLKFNAQGIISQTFNENRMPVGYVFSRRDEFPLVAIGQTTTNYKTGITISSQNLAFDFYTGNPLRVLYSDGYGNKYVSETVPAYSIDSYSGMNSTQVTNGFVGMGLKVNNPKNKHMLTQVAKTNTFKVNDNFASTQLDSDKVALVSASAQTWSDQVPVLAIGVAGANAPQTGVWRQRANYNFIGDESVALRPDGLYPYANFNEFTDWTGSSGTVNWQKISEIKLFDTYSHALEAMDMNGNFAATKMSLDQTRVFCTVANAPYQEFAYSGLEEMPDANGKLGGGMVLLGVSNSVSHSGTASASANAGQKAFSYSFTNSTAKKYHISVWSNKANGKINYKIGAGSEVSATVTATQAGVTGWYLIEADIDIPASTAVQISCSANGVVTLFDDFRVHPLKAAMVSYVYNKWGELTHILDNNNLYTEYEYDDMGRLKGVFKETLQHGRTKTSETQYNYANH